MRELILIAGGMVLGAMITKVKRDNAELRRDLDAMKKKSKSE